MSVAGGTQHSRDGETREPVGLPTLLAWRRTGLVASGAAVAAAVTAVLVRLAGGPAEVVAVAALVAVVGFFVGLGFLRRIWIEPELAGEPQAVRLRTWAGWAWGAWVLGVIVSIPARVWPDALGGLRWVAVGLYGVALVAYLGMLVLAVRWRPAH